MDLSPNSPTARWEAICRRASLDEILGEIMLGMKLLSAGMGVSNAPQGGQEDRLAANAAKI